MRNLVGRLAAAAILMVLAAPCALAQPAHGVAMHGEPAYPPDFTHFSYVDPDAPKGGSLVMAAIGLLDSMLVVSWIHARDDAGQQRTIEAEVEALTRDMPQLIEHTAISDERLEAVAVHRLALGGAEGRVQPEEWRRLFGETLARAADDATGKEVKR